MKIKYIIWFVLAVFSSIFLSALILKIISLFLYCELPWYIFIPGAFGGMVLSFGAFCLPYGVFMYKVDAD